MSTTTTKKKSWPKIGTVRKSDDGNRYIKFSDNVTILVDGKEIDMNKSRTANLTSPSEDLERMIKNNIVPEADVEKRRAQVESTKGWLLSDIVVPPPKTT